MTNLCWLAIIAVIITIAVLIIRTRDHINDIRLARAYKQIHALGYCNAELEHELDIAYMYQLKTLYQRVGPHPILN